MEYRIQESKKSTREGFIEENCNYIVVIQYKNGSNVGYNEWGCLKKESPWRKKWIPLGNLQYWPKSDKITWIKCLKTQIWLSLT
jgi:hypothetical protein